MSDSTPSQLYIPRPDEQRRIIAEAATVRATGLSRAVLLHGPGGIGKTRLVRELPAIADVPKTVWLDPIDVDDSQHWLLSNLERYVADQLDPDRTYFDQYLRYVSELPRHRHTPMSHASILDHLNRIKAEFTQCYKKYIDDTEHTVVISFDTVEAIRGMYLLRTLTHWMRELPGTLFILAGRSLPGAGDWRGPIRTALKDPAHTMDVSTVSLGEFSATDCRKYLSPISEEAGLDETQIEKLVHLTQGHPLWLAFTVDYLRREGLPEELDAALDQIRRDLPYHDPATVRGGERAESFKRRLVAPYQRTDFWHEAIRRMAVVRESISEPIWLELMDDRPMPPEVPDADEAWAELTNIDWIRPRANRRYVTLHDSVAEELAQRVIDLQDPDGRWREDLWRKAGGIYARQAAEQEGKIAELQADVDRRLAALGAATTGDASAAAASAGEAAVIAEITDLDGLRQELNQLSVARLFYQLLYDFPDGTRQFVALLRDAMERHDVLFEDLLAFQMQRFLPGGADEATLGDTVGAAITKFRNWLNGEGRDSFLQIGLELASYLIEREQLEAALSLLSHLPEPANPKLLYRLRNLQGNACLRIPGRVRDGGEYFERALAEASRLPVPDLYRYTADAHKERGFYYRNVGHWNRADEAYRQAYAAILRMPSSEGDDQQADREETASILSNWAYVKGIGGEYDDGVALVKIAIDIREKIGRRHGHAISLGVLGEVYRYQRKFEAAWTAYAAAEEVFQELSSWSWLGVIHQEQAICLFQSIQDGVQLPPDKPAEQAESLILDALDLCRIVNARAYPSALNRAGRIFGSKDPRRGLGYLREGAERAKGLSDGWFWLANLIEYAELCYRAWSDGAGSHYLQLIPAVAVQLHESEAEGVEFPELRGRWDVLQGHLAMHEVLNGNESMLESALASYRAGFPLITHGWVGSYGASAIFPGEFRKFRELVWQLPPETRARWQQDLRQDWSERPEAGTQLLARLEELS